MILTVSGLVALKSGAEKNSVVMNRFPNLLTIATGAPQSWRRPDVTSLILNRSLVAAAEAMIKNFRRCIERKQKIKFAGGNTASSGMVAVVVLRHMCRRVTLYGRG
jgi:hypothetical protein